jgi:phosphonate transport system ATP-binding protein
MLEIRDLRVVYANGYEALKSASLSVQDGEIVALIGRSGAGKSTILRCINGIQPVTSGSIMLHDSQVAGMSGKDLRLLRRKIGFVWQEHNLVERLSVMKNVLTGRLGYVDDLRAFVHYFDRSHRQVAVECLERVNMLHRAGQRADRLSGGEKQRVSIARALAQRPQIIVADEPVASLDIELSWQVMNDLVNVSRQENVPTIISIHDVELAKAFCDRIVGLAQGRIVFDGPPSALNKEAMDAIYRFDKPVNMNPAMYGDSRYASAGA